MRLHGANRLRNPRVLLSLLVPFISLAAISGMAAEPRVVFDPERVVECREVTSAEFAASHPTEKIIEARFRISVRLVAGQEKDLTELVFEVSSPGRRLRVDDIQPGTQLVSVYDGNIEVTKTTEKAHSVGVGLGGGVSVPAGAATVKVAPSANLGTSRRNVLTETQKKIPPKKAVVVSGTTHHRSGLFVKLKPSPQDALEGEKELICQFVVPHEWRGDWVMLSCRASGLRKHYFSKTTQPCGGVTLNVGLYLEGDGEARAASHQLAAAQDVARNKKPAPVFDLASLGSLLKCTKGSRPSDSNRGKTKSDVLTVHEARLILQSFSGQ